jgi:hypothetical protein
MTEPEVEVRQKQAGERPGISVARPGKLLVVLITSVVGAGYAIYWLIRSARG